MYFIFFVSQHMENPVIHESVTHAVDCEVFFNGEKGARLFVIQCGIFVFLFTLSDN